MKKSNAIIARNIVNNIWDDIFGRNGGDHFLESCDEQIQSEIKESWNEIIIEEITKHSL